MRNYLNLCALGLVLIFFSSCANVHQIDRGQLATRIMQFDPEPHKQNFIKETNAIREGSAGGAGQNAGGGCGCN